VVVKVLAAPLALDSEFETEVCPSEKPFSLELGDHPALTNRWVGT
jgi:hypothetical protein